LHKETPSIAELRGGIPPRLERLLARMLAKDREERISSAAQVADELAAIERELPDETLSAPAASVQSQVPTYALPRRTTAAPPAPAAPPPAPLPAPRAARPARAAAPSPALGRPPPRRDRRGLLVALVLGAVVVVLGVVGAGWYWTSHRLKDAVAEMTSTSTPANPAVSTESGAPAAAPSTVPAAPSSSPSSGALAPAPPPAPPPP